MSLRDTITGALGEARENFTKPETPAAADQQEAAHKGFSRRSAARARPAREAASSVRTEDGRRKGSGPVTKEERRAQRQRERESQDLRSRAYDVVVKSIPGYRKADRIFWVLMGVGFVFAVISGVLAFVFKQTTDLSTAEGIASVASLVIAYVFIIASFVFDMFKRRPIRRQAEARMRGLTDKRVRDLLEQDAKAKKK